MSKKLTIGFIKSEFSKEGYRLLTTEYKNSKQKLDYICPNGHRHSIIWNVWQRGHRCPYCYGKAKLTIDFIKSEFEKEGYRLLTTEYINNNQNLYYICHNGHKYSIRWGNWQQGSRCSICYGNVKHHIDFIKSEFEKENYQLLTTEYNDNKQKLDYICPNGHQHSIIWNAWQRGHRCPTCAINKKRQSLDFIKSEFAKEDYQLLTTEYKNSKQKLNYICSNGHQHSISWDSWKSGRRCPTCGYFRRFGETNSSWQGGISFEPYCPIWSDKEYKSDIKLRDGNVCLNPYCFHGTKKLHIHHIDYDKKNCAPQNLITVCRSCNARANFDRTWHTEWYRNILSKRYGYNYGDN